MAEIQDNIGWNYRGHRFLTCDPQTLGGYDVLTGDLCRLEEMLWSFAVKIEWMMGCLPRLISNLHCLVALSTDGKGFRSLPRGKIRSRSPGGSLCHSVNFCDVAGTSCIGSCLSIELFQRRGERGLAAWVTAYPPYFFTHALCSGEDTLQVLHIEHIGIVSQDWRMPFSALSRQYRSILGPILSIMSWI